MSAETPAGPQESGKYGFLKKNSLPYLPIAPHCYTHRHTHSNCVYTHMHSRPTYLILFFFFYADESFSSLTDFEGWKDARKYTYKVDQVFTA